MSRPGLLKDASYQELKDALRKGGSAKGAAKLLGVVFQTFYKELDRRGLEIVLVHTLREKIVKDTKT